MIENWKQLYSLNLSLLDLISFLFAQQFCNSIRKDLTLIYWSVWRCVCVCVCVNKCDELYSISSSLLFWWKFITLKRRIDAVKFQVGVQFKGCCFLPFFTPVEALKGVIVEEYENGEKSITIEKCFALMAEGAIAYDLALEELRMEELRSIGFNAACKWWGKCKCFFKILE